MIRNFFRSVFAGTLLIASFVSNAATTTYSDTNAPGAHTDYSVVITAETSLLLTVPDDVGLGSYILLKKDTAPADNDDFDFSSRVDDVENQLYLTAPELTPGTWFVRVLTPAAESGSHSYTLTVDTDAEAEAGGPYPITRSFDALDVDSGALIDGESVWYRIEVEDDHDGWRLAVHTSGLSSVLLRRDSTSGTYIGGTSQKRQHTFHRTVDQVNAGEVYYLQIAATEDTDIALSSDPVYARTLTWDPGTASLGSNTLNHPDQVGGDYYFKIASQTPNYGAWRFALNVEAGEADLFIQQNSVPTTSGSYWSQDVGDDGYVLTSNQFTSGQDWYIKVSADADSEWELYSGDIYVHTLGDCTGGGLACELPAYNASNDVQVEVNKSVTVGPEGIAYFRTQVPVGTRAWRLFTRDEQHTLFVKRDAAPTVYSTGYSERSEALQMLLVPDYLTSDLYYVGVQAPADSTVFLDSRQQEIRIPGGDGFNFTIGGIAEDKVEPTDSIGYGYITYEVDVPVDQIAWQVRATPTAGDVDVYVRQGEVPNVNENNGFSEAPGLIVDSVTQVPPSLTDGNWYITVRGEGTFTVELDSKNPPIPTISFLNDGTPLLPHNDCEDQAGWCYYVVDMDNQAQLDTLGWELALANQAPGTAIAIRDGGDGVPAKIQYRENGSTQIRTVQYVDLIDDGGVLQDPAHQAAIWYVGIYNPGQALGNFELTTYEPVTTPVAFQTGGAPVSVSGQAPDLLKFFRVEVPAGALGWDVRLGNVTSGEPRMVIMRDTLPSSISSTHRLYERDAWNSGESWSPGNDSTGRSQDAAGNNEYYRVFHAGVTSPITAPGTYYIAVKGASDTGDDLSYTVQSRGIGEGAGWSIPVETVSYAGGVANGTGLAPRDIAYYKVTVPANSRSLQVELDVAGNGEALMLVRHGRLPNVSAVNASSRDTDQVGYYQGIRLKKTGDEYFYKYQPSNGEFITAGDYYIAVVSEGQSPANTSRIGTGTVDYTLTVGEVPVDQQGATPVALSVTNDEGNPLAWAGQSLAYGEQKSYRFRVTEAMSFLEVRLTNTSGAPYMAAEQAGIDDGRMPSISDSTYADEGGNTPDGQGPNVVTLTEPNGDITVVVSANRDGSNNEVAATFDLEVVAFGEVTLDFDSGSAAISNQAPDTWRYFRVDVPAGALGWDVRLGNVTSGEPRMMISRDTLPSSFSSTYRLYEKDAWGSGNTWSAPSTDSTCRGQDAAGNNEYYRVFHAGVTSPITAPGTYYIAVKGASDTGDDLSYTVQSRGIGEGAGWSIPVETVSYAGGVANGTGLAPRDIAYYKVTVPANSRSLQVELDVAGNGEALMLVRHGRLPNVSAVNASSRDTDQVGYYQGIRLKKTGDEYFYKYQPSNGEFITAGDYYIAVVSEGQSPANTSRIGTGTVDYTLTVGEVPVDQQGATPVALSVTNDEGNPLAWAGQSLAYGEQKSYRFRVTEAMSFLEVRLTNTSGAPYMAAEQAGIDDGRMPSISDSTYADEGGNTPDGQGPNVVTLTEPNGDITVVVSANRDGSNNEVAATFDLEVVAFGEVTLDFDSGSAAISNQAPDTWRYFRVEVPAGALGWDVRLGNVTSGEPRMMISRDSLPSSFSNTYRLYEKDAWGSGNTWSAPSTDATGRSQDAVGNPEYYRVLHAGVTSPITAPGTYYIAVKGASDTGDDLSYTVQSRGIGEGAGWSIPVETVSYAGGVANGTGLAPRDIAYYKVTVPANSRSLQVELDVAGNGEALMLVRHGRLPNVSAVNAGSRDTDQVNYYQGIRLKKTGDEYFYKYQPSNGEFITAGDYYIAVVSEGQSPANTGRIGTGTVDYTLTVGEVPVDQQGATPVILTAGNDAVNPLTWSGQSLAYGEQKSYRYQVDSGLQALEVRLVNTTGMPYLSLGEDVTGPGKMPYISDSTAADEGGVPPIGQSAYFVTDVNPQGVHTVTVSANRLGNSEANASYDLQVVAKDIEADLAFDGGSASAQLLNEQMHFYRVVVPAGGLSSGWKISLETTTGSLIGRVQKDVPPAINQGMSLSGARRDTVFTTPILTAGTWYIALKASGITDYTISSAQVAPEQNLAYAGASSGEVDIEQGRWHFYTVDVPDGNTGALRTVLEAVSGDPELYIRQHLPPTLDHRSNSQTNGSSMYDRYDTGNGDRYGNWVPREDVDQLSPGTYWLAVYGNGSNVRYQMHVNSGNITDLPTPTYAVAGETLAAGDIAYYRFVMPDVSAGPDPSLVESLTLSLTQNQGDVLVFIRDEIPPGQGTYLTDWRDWDDDNRYVNPNPYISIDDTGDTIVDATALIPGQTYYLGVYARNDADYDLQVSFASGMIALEAILDFQTGAANTILAPGEEQLFLVDMPVDSSRWKHTSTHDSSVEVYIRELALPFGNSYDDWASNGAADSSLNCYLPQCASGRWEDGQRYFIRVVNTSGSSQPFSLQFEGKLVSNDDEDADGLLDWWEWQYFNGLHRTPAFDSDNDGVTDGDEYNEGTDPTDRFPTLTIDSPLDASMFTTADLIVLNGTATDLEDGDLGAEISWTSSQDGFLGNGDGLTISLSPGSHVITASVIDSAGAEPRPVPSITIEVEAATSQPGDVNDDGQVNIGDLLLMQRHVTGIEVLDAAAIIRGDIAPEGSPDGVLDLKDQLLLQQRLLSP